MAFRAKRRLLCKEIVMNKPNSADSSKKVKNIAAVIYLLVLIFVVGGSYLDQQRSAAETARSEQPLSSKN